MNSLRFAILVLLVLPSVPLARAQQPAAAPVPAAIFSAQKIFLANTGMDAYSQNLFGHFGLQPTKPYDTFYTSLKTWGRYQLVTAPADADLVFTIGTSEQETGCGVGAAQFQTVITVYDAKTHFPLWSLTQPIQLANRAETWRKNIATANDNLIAQLKSLLTPAAPANP